MAVKPNFFVEWREPPRDTLAAPYRVNAPSPAIAVKAIAQRTGQPEAAFIARPIIDGAFRVIR